MDQRYRRRAFVTGTGGGDHDEPQSSSENGETPPSGDDSRAATPAALSPKKGRKSIKKRVVSVAIGDVEGSNRSGGNPPSDSWAWRKYGQKPIKGSPYPRGYYRCSSSKGCPARKQVERSRLDPTTLVITYACDHNHPVPTSRYHQHSSASTAVPSSPPAPTTPEEAANEYDANIAAAAVEDEFPSEERKELLTCATELGLGDAVLMEFSWLSEAPSSFVGPIWDDDDVLVMLPAGMMREEEKSLFGDLDELPECSAVFRSGRGISCQKMPAVPSPLFSSSTG